MALAATIVVVGLVASGIAASAADHSRRAQIQETFDATTTEIAQRVTLELSRYELAATALGSFVSSGDDTIVSERAIGARSTAAASVDANGTIETDIVDEPSAAEAADALDRRLQRFMRPIVERMQERVFPAIWGIAYLELTDAASVQAVRERFEANGRTLDVDATKRAEYAFVQYVYPENSMFPVGFDAFNVQTLTVALLMAKTKNDSVLAALPVEVSIDEEGGIVADDGVTRTEVDVTDEAIESVPSPTSGSKAAAIVKPVYAAVPEDPKILKDPALRGRLIGWAVAFVNVAAVIEESIDANAAIAVSAGAAGGAERLGTVGEPDPKEPSDVRIITIFGDDFRLEFAGERGFSDRAAEGQNPLTIFVVGSLITFLIAIGLWFITSSLERRRRIRAIRHVATHDGLTDLPNRDLLLDRLDAMVPRSRKSEDAVAVCCIDVDRFKIVNDTLGHDAGDAVLIEVAARLRALAGPNDVVARLGGDEFAVVAPYRIGAVEGLVDARQLGQLVIAELSRPIQTSGGAVKIDVSVGIAVAPVDSRDAEELVRFAESAVQHAKQSDSGRAVRFDETVRQRVVARRDTEAALVHAVADNQLEAFFQPFHSLDDGRVVAYEALVRWIHPERGLLTPGEFLPDAEANGTIVDIDRWMCRESVRRAALWNSDGYGRVTVWVNASVRSLVQADFAATVRDALEDFDLDATRLGIEVDETVLDIDPEIAARALGPIREMGVRVALDDFGGGSSSLTVLRRFPIDLLKLDRSLVEPLGTGDEAEQLVQTVVGMAHSLGITVIAEGIETIEQRDVAARCGCDLAQGYLYARPGSIEDINRTRRRGGTFVEHHP